MPPFKVRAIALAISFDALTEDYELEEYVLNAKDTWQKTSIPIASCYSIRSVAEFYRRSRILSCKNLSDIVICFDGLKPGPLTEEQRIVLTLARLNPNYQGIIHSA